MNEHAMRQVAARGKYAPLFRHLASLDARSWRATFRDVESILGFSLPNSARSHRRWWSNRSNGRDGHALAWQAAGWKTHAVDLAAEALVFEHVEGGPLPKNIAPDLSMRALFPPHDFGTWPDGFAANREQIYGDHGR